MDARRARRLAILLLLLVTPRGAAADGPATIELAGPDHVTQLLRADVTGDGVTDVVLASGRTIYVWSGGNGKLPGAEPTSIVTLPDDVSFVDAGENGSLVGLGRQAAYQIPLSAEPGPTRTPLPGLAIDWSAHENAVFVDFQIGGGLLVPVAPNGEHWALLGLDRKPTALLDTTADRYVEQAGPFLEDTATVTVSWPHAVLAKAPDGSGGAWLWAFDGPRLVAQSLDRRVEYDLAFLPTDGERSLVDLDADGLPDVVHRKTGTREGQYGFFHTPRADPGAKAGPTHAPARAFIRLSGFHLDPDFVDVDGDGRLDFVLTSMEVDAKNTLRAMTSGMVTALTRVFLNRVGTYFADEPDAAAESDVGVNLQFTYAGTIEVTRSLTLVVDGDFDGDGRLDLAVRTGPDRIRIRRGVAQGVWEAGGRDVAIPTLGAHRRIEAYAVDTDGNDEDELLLVYRAEKGAPERLVLVDP